MGKWTRRAAIGGGIAAAAGGASLGWLASKPGGAVDRPGRSRAAPVRVNDPLPRQVDAVVIGGGYVGCAAALELAERGLSVALCEKGVIAGEASGRSVGWVDSQFLDPVKMELIARSKHLWSRMNRRTGQETGWRERGLTSLLADEEAVEGARQWLDGVRGAPGVTARIVDGGEAARLQPGASRSWAGAMYQPNDASVEPTLAAPAMARAAHARGATLHQMCAVRGIERSGGAISGVVTERGAIRCRIVVLAGGLWSPVFARSIGLDLPQFQANASMARVAGIEGPDISSWGPGFCWRRQIDGSYTIGDVNGVTPITAGLAAMGLKLLPALRNMWGEVDPVFDWGAFADDWRRPRTWALDGPSPFEANRIYTPEVRSGLLDTARDTIAATFPVFRGAHMVERWAGTLVTTPDNMPVISAVDGVPGLILGTGFYYGLTMGPAGGEALADIATGRTPRIDLSRYRYSRFSDGSAITFRS